MWHVCFVTRVPRPLARAWNRLSTAPRSTCTFLTFSESMSAPSLCSALAIADSSTFFTSAAPFFGVNARMLRALSTGLSRIMSATSRPFCAESRTPRRIARVSIAPPLLLRRRRGSGGRRSGRRRIGSRGARRAAGPPRRSSRLLDALARGRVALEDPSHRKLAELVPDHVLGHVDRNVLLAVVHGDRQTDEIGHDRGAPRPGLDRALVA